MSDAANNIWYKFCSDHHCPKCQSLARADWIQERQSELPDTRYFHLVYTVPEEIPQIALQNKRTVYGMLFRATADTLLTIAADPKHRGTHLRHSFVPTQ